MSPARLEAVLSVDEIRGRVTRGYREAEFWEWILRLKLGLEAPEGRPDMAQLYRGRMKDHQLTSPDERRERARAMLSMRDAGATLEEIGEVYELTRERVRQIMRDEWGLSGRNTLARTQAATLERLQRRLAGTHACPVCGYWVIRRHMTCSTVCARDWAVLRYHLDPVHRGKHRRAVARWHLAHISTGAQVRFARRVLDGTAEERGRWILPGSAAARAWARLPSERRRELERELGIRLIDEVAA